MEARRDRMTRESWKGATLCSLPEKRAELKIERLFSEEEYEKISLGLNARSMDEKWVAIVENNVLHFYRSWTGKCIYRAVFDRSDEKYIVSEAFVNRDVLDYKETDDHYDELLLLFLIENLLLGNQTPFPLKEELSEILKGAMQHSIAGTGYQEKIIKSDKKI